MIVANQWEQFSKGNPAEWKKPAKGERSGGEGGGRGAGGWCVFHRERLLALCRAQHTTFWGSVSVRHNRRNKKETKYRGIQWEQIRIQRVLATRVRKGFFFGGWGADTGYSKCWGPDTEHRRVKVHDTVQSGGQIQNRGIPRDQIWDTADTGDQRKDTAGAADQVHNARGHGTEYSGYRGPEKGYSGCCGPGTQNKGSWYMIHTGSGC